MEKKVKKISIENYSDSALIIIDCDPETAAKIAEFASKLNTEIQTQNNAKQG